LTPAHLVPAVLAAVRQNPNIQPGALASHIKPYVRDPWGPQKLGRLKHAALSAIGVGKDPKADTARIRPVAEALKDKGWFVETFSLSGSEMQKVAVDANRGQWEWRERTRKKNDSKYSMRCFDPDQYKLTDQYQGISLNRRYHHGWVAAPPYNWQGSGLNRNGAFNELTNKVTDSDMTFNTSSVGGNVFFRGFQSANRAGIPLMVGHIVGNESTATHRIYEDYMLEVYGDEYNCHGIVDIQDGDKGGDNAFRSVFTNGPSLFVCEYHAKNKVLLHGSAKTDKSVYEEAVRAPKLEGVQTALDKLSVKALEWVDKREQAELFPAALSSKGVHIHGRSASQTAESFNNTILVERALLPGAGLYAICKKINDKYHRERQEALSHTGKVPPRVENDLQSQIAFSKRYTQVGDNLNHTYNVKSAQEGSNVVYTVDVPPAPAVNVQESDGSHPPGAPMVGVKKMGCNCKRVGTVDPYACGHMCAVADKFGLDIRDYVPEWATTEAWQRQYAEPFPFPGSLEDCLEGRTLTSTENLDTPPIAFTAKGRPTKSRQLGALESSRRSQKSQDAKVFFCSQCGIPGHTKRSCRGIKEPRYYDDPLNTTASAPRIAPVGPRTVAAVTAAGAPPAAPVGPSTVAAATAAISVTTFVNADTDLRDLLDMDM
jgi:hypothetical protein